MSFRDLGLLKVSLNNINQGKEGSEFLALFHVLLLVLSPIHKKALIFPGLPSADTPAEALSLTFHKLNPSPDSTPGGLWLS